MQLQREIVSSLHPRLVRARVSARGRRWTNRQTGKMLDVERAGASLTGSSPSCTVNPSAFAYRYFNLFENKLFSPKRRNVRTDMNPRRCNSFTAILPRYVVEKFHYEYLSGIVAVRFQWPSTRTFIRLQTFSFHFVQTANGIFQK